MPFDSKEESMICSTQQGKKNDHLDKLGKNGSRYKLGRKDPCDKDRKERLGKKERSRLWEGPTRKERPRLKIQRRHDIAIYKGMRHNRRKKQDEAQGERATE